MRTLESGSRTTVVRRDFALLCRLAVMLFQYLVPGGRLRREYKRKEARGDVYWLDASGPTQHREEALHR
jgi:hypothetical protein